MLDDGRTSLHLNHSGSHLFISFVPLLSSAGLDDDPFLFVPPRWGRLSTSCSRAHQHDSLDKTFVQLLWHDLSPPSNCVLLLGMPELGRGRTRMGD